MSIQQSNTNPVLAYNSLLARRPLLTKMVTGAVLSALSELISQCTTLNTQTTSEKPKSGLYRLKQLLLMPKYRKMVFMLLYGGLVNAPINHYFYRWLTLLTSQKVGPKWRRLAQLCGSWFVISPIQVFGLITALTLVNLDTSKEHISQKIKAVWASLKSRYGPMLTSSIVSSTVFVSVAQQYISTEKWSVFFSFAYAMLNTGQNIYMKLSPGQTTASKTSENLESDEPR
ncbi:LAME_0F05424g1_1 [Lachancea meyersii CBS 8951]|uniref:Protein SYM1 n=1 Tax=Lachancea meyersii CBS 8951 TaxID=1266667 RepID=A0A1G4JSZ6_9SACH|nr:LAME_0F05424g1_1 [Lachancea meyersii CBS 8951]